MARYRIKAPKTRPIDSRDRLPGRQDKVLVFLKGVGWVSLVGQDVRNLHRFSSGPIYWTPSKVTS